MASAERWRAVCLSTNTLSPFESLKRRWRAPGYALHTTCCGTRLFGEDFILDSVRALFSQSYVSSTFIPTLKRGVESSSYCLVHCFFPSCFPLENVHGNHVMTARIFFHVTNYMGDAILGVILRKSSCLLDL